jgi:HEAT repeat protein
MVRARATRALGVLGDQSAIDPLRGVATDESASRELRDLAADTISWLEQP